MVNSEERESRRVDDEKMQDACGGFSGHVGQYDGVIEQTYYFVYDDNHDVWFKGVLKASYEKHILWWTERKHDVLVGNERSSSLISWYGRMGENCEVGSIMTLAGNEWSMFRCR